MKLFNNQLNIQYLWLFLCLTFGYTKLSGQSSFGVDSLSTVLIKEQCSSVWGMTHSSGVELGLLGTRAGLRIYNLTHPESPEEILFIPGNECLWRELKSYKDFVYVVTECEDGLLIVDMRNINDIHYRFQKNYFDADSNHFEVTRSHTLFIDEKGYLYLAGSDHDFSGFVVLDLSVNPEFPIWLNAYREEYYHEVFVHNDTLYGASIYNGEFVLWDIYNRKTPVRLSSQQTGAHFTHSVWKENLNPILYTADETTGAFVESWDVSNPTQIRRLDRFRANYPVDKSSIPHNVFFKDGYLFISWYTEGVRILDVRRPTNIQEVAYFDTHPQAETGFHGVWNVYPYFDSGIILASDIENGMFVMRFNKNKACFLEGTVKDQLTGQSIANAEIVVESFGHQTTDYSNISGEYSTGFMVSTTAIVHVKKPAYVEFIDTILLKEDSIVIKNFELVPEVKYTIGGEVRHDPDDAVEENVHLKIWNNDFSYETVSDAQGNVQIPNIVLGEYQLQLSKWGRLLFSVDHFLIDDDIFFKVLMEDGYEDQFNFDNHWKFIPDSVPLVWKIGNFKELSPIPSNYPSADLTQDLGNQALYTNNFSDDNAAQNVVGDHNLFSPAMDLSGYDEINLNYTAWAYGGWESSIKETYLMLNDEKIALEQIKENLSGKFNPSSSFNIDLRGKTRTNAYFVMHFWNDPDSVNYAITLKAALDGFRLTGKLKTELTNTQESEVMVYPNPFQDNLYIQNNSSSDLDSECLDVNGKLLKRFNIPAKSKFLLETEQLPAQIYFLKYNDAHLKDKWNCLKIQKH